VLADAVRTAVLDTVPVAGLAGAAAEDLYGGVGLFAEVLARLVGAEGQVVTVEGDRSASALAGENLAQHGGVRAECRSVLDWLRGPGVDHAPEVVVLDPPRSGAGPVVCRALADRAPRVVVYVACDPAALARDTAALQESGYRLAGLRAFDCFPQTHHVECVASFVPAD
jgi:tRNA/tmRNA/rRNA uracil-C5-methylase (TrmA/RlmC/RlmD family)